MPFAPPRPCTTCGVLHCTVHTRPPWHHRNKVSRIRGRKLQTLRSRLFAQEPYCRMCREQGRLTVATIRDHVVPLAEGGLDVEGNTQPLCQSCSDSKTRDEARRGVQRWR